MDEKPLILKTPKEYFDEATRRAIVGAYFIVRAAELAITNPIEARLLKSMSEESMKQAIHQLAHGLAAASLLGKVGIPYLNSLDPRLRTLVAKHMPTGV